MDYIRMTKKFLCCLELVVLLLLFTGCGEKITGNVEEAPEESESMVGTEDMQGEFVRPPFDSETTIWKAPVASKTRENLYVAGYAEYEDSGDAYRYRDQYGACFYGFVAKEETGFPGEVLIYNGETGEVTSMTPSFAEYTGDGDRMEIFCVQKKDNIIFLYERYKGLEVECIKLLHYNIAGECVKQQDITNIIREEHFYNRDNIEYWGNSNYDLQADEEGFCYLYMNSGQEMLVLDPEGNKREIMYPLGKLTVVDSYVAYTPVREPSGDLFFILWGNMPTKYCFRYDKEKQEYEKIMDWDGSTIQNAVMTKEGYVYFTNNSNLARWDMCTGAMVDLLDVERAGITTNNQLTRLSLNQDGLPILFVPSSNLSSYRLGYEEGNHENDLRIVSLTSYCTDLMSAAAEYSRKHVEEGIQVEIPEGDADTVRTGILTELTAGKGPEAMYVTGADMAMLYEKGLLEPMEDVLSKETKDALFQGALECGRIDGVQVGLPVNSTLFTVVTDKSVWGKNSWSLKDVLSLAESGDFPRLESMLANYSGYVYGGNKLGELNVLILQDLGNTPFYDRKNGICHFDTPDFIRVLEACNKYGEQWTRRDGEEYVAGEKELGFYANGINIQEFSEMMENLQETAHCVGLPAADGTGAYWSADYYLVLRKGADRKDVIRSFMESIYSVQKQKNNKSPIRKDIYVGITDYDEWDGYKEWYVGDGKYLTLRTKKNGDTWVKEYIEMAVKAKAKPQDTGVIEEIVLEEAAVYFAGDRDVSTTAKMIQSRVEIYLAEQGK